MDTQEIIERLEAEWDLEGGFLGRLRGGTFDPDGFLRFEQLLESIQFDNETSLNRRLVALIWYVPIFISALRGSLISSPPTALSHLDDNGLGLVNRRKNDFRVRGRTASSLFMPLRIVFDADDFLCA